MKRTGIVLLFLYYVTSCYVCHGAIKEYVYEFGLDYGTPIFNHHGHIPLFHRITKQDILVPPGYKVSYVKVIVRAWNKPQVAFSPLHNQVTISYDWTQITVSNYSVFVKGIYSS